MIDSSQLNTTGLKGNVTLSFNIDDFAQIYGEDLILLEGARYAYKKRINSPTMALGELQIDVYTLRLPTGKDQNYHPSQGYLMLKQGDNAVEIDFVKKAASPIVSQELICWG